MSYLLRGMVIGFSIAAPVGPIGVLCIRRSLAKGRLSGFVTGMGAASADAIYGVIAAFGLTFVSSFLVEQQLALQGVGAAFLLYLGVRALLAKANESQVGGAVQTRLITDYASTLALTLTNPMTILSFAAVFAGLGLAEAAGDYLSAATLVLGVFLGSAGWWLLLSMGVGLVRDRIEPGILVWVNRASGAIIIAFALVLCASVLRELL